MDTMDGIATIVAIIVVAIFLGFGIHSCKSYHVNSNIEETKRHIVNARKSSRQAEIQAELTKLRLKKYEECIKKYNTPLRCEKCTNTNK